MKANELGNVCSTHERECKGVLIENREENRLKDLRTGGGIIFKSTLKKRCDTGEKICEAQDTDDNELPGFNNFRTASVLEKETILSQKALCHMQLVIWSVSWLLRIVDNFKITKETLFYCGH